MFEWTPEDQEAEREGRAILRSLRCKIPKRPHGISIRDIQKDKEAKHIMELIKEGTR